MQVVQWRTNRQRQKTNFSNREGENPIQPKKKGMLINDGQSKPLWLEEMQIERVTMRRFQMTTWGVESKYVL